MRGRSLAAILAAAAAVLPNSRGQHRSYYDPVSSPRPRNHRASRYIPKADRTVLADTLRANARAKRARRAARRKAVQS